MRKETLQMFALFVPLGAQVSSLQSPVLSAKQSKTTEQLIRASETLCKK